MNTGRFATWPFRGADKVLHGIITFAIMLMAFMCDQPFMGAVICIVLTLAKELWDARDGGEFSLPDLIAGAVGALVATVVVLVR